MGLYENIKEVAKIVQKADNIDLYSKLLDLSEQALELQNKNRILEEEIDKLKKQKDLTKNVVRHEETYITLRDDKDDVMYCSSCFDNSNKLIQIKKYDDGMFYCPICKNNGHYDKELFKKSLESNNDNSIIVLG